jgi:predicted TIM-barrel fold metal-dependent hydrolase
MRSFVSLICVLSLAVPGMSQASAPSGQSTDAAPQRSKPAASQPGATEADLKDFIALDPIDAHTHIYRNDSAFSAMLQRLHLHVLDILVVDVNDTAAHRTFAPLKQAALEFVSSNPHHAVLSTSFDPFTWNEPGFPNSAIASINQDFAHGAVGVTTWTNLGMQLKDASGKPAMLDDPRLEAIYKDIATQHKTLIAHITTADEAWAPDAASNPPTTGASTTNSEHPVSPILQSRDRLLQQNPGLRVVGAHFGSLKEDLNHAAIRLHQDPYFAVDTSGRLDGLMTQPREQVLAFIVEFQDRILYGSDMGFRKADLPESVVTSWQTRYALDWRFLATDDIFEYKGHQVHGLRLPQPILRKLFHDNALHWIPGIAP